MDVPAGSGREDDKHVVLGKINGVSGVRGWLKIYSYSRPRESIFSYSHWLIREDGKWRARKLVDGKQQGRKLLALLDGISDRDAALAMVGLEVAIERRQLAALEEGEYYWCDLIDLEVLDLSGRSFGQVVDIKETGANDVLVVKGDERYLIPLVHDKIVKQVDVEGGMIRVDWDPEYI